MVRHIVNPIKWKNLTDRMIGVVEDEAAEEHGAGHPFEQHTEDKDAHHNNTRQTTTTIDRLTDDVENDLAASLPTPKGPAAQEVTTAELEAEWLLLQDEQYAVYCVWDKVGHLKSRDSCFELEQPRHWNRHATLNLALSRWC